MTARSSASLERHTPAGSCSATGAVLAGLIPCAPMPKIERSPSLVSTPKLQPVTRPGAAEAVATRGPVTQYAGQAIPQKELVPRGTNVSKSASPSTLWGDAPRQVVLDPAAFAKLAAADQQKVVEAAKAEREQLGGQIVARVEVLDHKWNNSRLSTRTDALREYEERCEGRLDGKSRRKLDGLVGRSEDSQRKINELRVKIDQLPKTPEAKKAQVALRTELARELHRARDEQSRAVKEATAVVDAAGLKTDRLAVTEQIIDPSAPAQGSGDSLLDKIVRFIKLDGFFTSIKSWFQTMHATFEQRSERLDEEMKLKESARLVTVAIQRAEENAVIDKARAVVSPFATPKSA